MYKFILDGIALPVAPEKVEIKIKNMNKTISTASGGEINIINSPGLTDIDFQVLLPNVPYPFANYPTKLPAVSKEKEGFRPASFYLGHFERLMLAKAPFKFYIIRQGQSGAIYADYNIMKVSLEGYTIVEDVNSAPDMLVQLSLKQYKDYGLRIQPVVSGKVSPITNTPKPKPKTPKPYVVKKGDTLWGICRKQLGDGSKYKQIAKLNHIANPNRIYPGQVIRFA